MNEPSVITCFGSFELDEGRAELRCAGAPVDLAPKPFQLLMHLVHHRDRVVPKQELLDAVWPDVFVSETALSSAIKEVRRAVGDSGGQQEVVRTLRGRGYRFVAPVTVRRTGLSAGVPDRGLPDERAPLLVGRRRELSELESDLAEVMRGQGRVAILSGEPGIGKTRIATEVEERARARNLRVYASRCIQGGGVPAFWPWVQLLRAALREAGREIEISAEEAAVIRQSMADLEDVLPAKSSELSPLQPEEARFRFFDRLAAILKRLATRAPMLLVIDDLQWADVPTLRLLEFVAGELHATPILILGACREAELERETPKERILGEVLHAASSRSILLHGLTPGETAELWQGLGREAIDASAAAALQRRTGGNPFFVERVAEMQGDAPGEERTFEPGGGVRGAVSHHLNALSPLCVEVLGAAAVIGREFSVDLLAAASALRPRRVLELLDEAARDHIVRAAPEGPPLFQFAHDLIRETLYDGLGARTRGRAHRRVALALEAAASGDASARLPELALHFLAAVRHDGDVAKAVEYSVQAGAQAAARLAHEEARDHYARALDALELDPPVDEARRAEIEIELGRMCAYAREPERAIAILDRVAESARQAGQWELLTRAACHREEAGVFLGASFLLDSETLALLEEALEALSTDAVALRVTLLSHLARRLFYQRETERAVALGREALAAAEGTDDAALQIAAIEGLYWALWEPPHAAERLSLTDRAIELSRGTRSRGQELAMRYMRASSLADLGRFGEMRAELDRVRQLDAVMAGVARGDRWVLDAGEAMLLMLRGELDEAEAAIQKPLTKPGERGGRADVKVVVGGQLMLLRFLQGRPDEMALLLKELPERFSRSWIAARAFACAELGQLAEARAHLEALAADDFQPVASSIHWLMLFAFLAETSARLGHRESAAPIYERLLPTRAAQVMLRPGVGSWGPTERYLGLLAATLDRFDAGEEHFESALASCESMGAWPWQAFTEFNYARMLRRRNGPGDRSRADALRDAALEKALDLKLGGLVRRISAGTG